MTRSADVVVIGSGGFGAATAYELARRGQDVVLVDRFAIASQTSPRAAGLAATVRSTDLMTSLATAAAELYVAFEEETGRSVGVVRCGSIKMARVPEDVEILHRDVEMGRRHGLGTAMIDPAEIPARHPLVHPAGILAGMVVPTDIYFEPSQAAISFAAAAAALGATLVPNNPVTGILRHGDRVTGVETLSGSIHAPVVVDAAGAWARQIAGLAGYGVPLAPMRHQLLVTEPIDGVHPLLPALRFIDAAVYARPSWGGLLVGGYEDAPEHVDMTTVPASFEVSDLALDFSVLQALLDKVSAQLPVLAHPRVRVHRGGVPTLTVDGQHIVDQVPGVRGMFVAAGCNVSGLSMAPVIGKLLAEWVVDGAPSVDLGPMAITRFGPEWQDQAAVRAAAESHYATFYRSTI